MIFAPTKDIFCFCHEVAALFPSSSFPSSAVVCRQVMQRRILMVFSERELPIASSAVKPLHSLGTTVLHLTNSILERRNSEQTYSLRESKSNCQYGMDLNCSRLTQKEHKWPSGCCEARCCWLTYTWAQIQHQQCAFFQGPGRYLTWLELPISLQVHFRLCHGFLEEEDAKGGIFCPGGLPVLPCSHNTQSMNADVVFVCQCFLLSHCILLVSNFTLAFTDKQGHS